MSSHGQKTTVLFITLPEIGQSNSIFALAFELMTHPNVDVHLASFPELRNRAKELSSSPSVADRTHPGSSFTFHEIAGISFEKAIEAKGLSGASFPHPPLAKSHDEGIAKLLIMLTCWNGEEYVTVVESCQDIINTVNPSIVIVDSHFSAACEACWSLNKRYIINCPMAPLSIVRDSQPIWKTLFYYPVFGSGIPFQIPWSYIPKNVMLNLAFVVRILGNPDFKKLMNHRHSHGYPGDFPMGGPSVRRSVHTFCFGLPELELPITLPQNVGLYGPVALDSTPLSKEDELSTWLDGGRTIVMSMGTHFNYSEAQVRSTIRGFIAGTSSTDQIFWKLHDEAKFRHVLDEELENERAKERFRIVDWIDGDPGEIMKHKNVVAYVHHGGANSYYEAAGAGIPQIILAQWFDLYDMAVRAEYVGIGIYGNRNVAPDIDATEFGAAISRLLSPGEAKQFARKAKEIGEACRMAPGKKGAVAKILELVEDEDSGA